MLPKNQNISHENYINKRKMSKKNIAIAKLNGSLKGAEMPPERSENVTE